jgi:F-type H+-transporting ATPase subunit b
MLSTILLAAEDGAAHAANNAILPHEIDEVIWGTIAFVLVAALLWWKGLPAAKSMAAARTERIEKALADAEAERRSAETALAELNARIANADEECARILAEADETAASLKQQLIAKADSDAVDVRQRAVEDAASAESQVAHGLEVEVGRLAIGAAEVVVANSLDDVAQSELIDKYIAQVGSSS